MAASIRTLKMAARQRGPHRYYRPLRGSRWTIEENRLWADKRARQRQDANDLETGRVTSLDWFARDGVAKQVTLRYRDGSDCPL